jgi:hypothetical protein
MVSISLPSIKHLYNTFIKNLLLYTSIDKDLAQKIVQKCCVHFWYLSAELSEFAFIDEAVLLETKKKKKLIIL